MMAGRVFANRGTAIGGVAAAALVGALVWAFVPDPVQVDIVIVAEGPMEITVTAEGKTRIRDPWLVTAPITGTTARSPVEVGDTVTGGQTIVAVIEPAAPALLDARTRRQAEAAVIEAQAAVRLAEVELARAEASRTYYAVQLERNRALAERGTIARRLLEESEQQATTAAAVADEARFNLELRRATLDRMEAQLSGPESGSSLVATDGTVPPSDDSGAPADGDQFAPADDCCIRITAPHDGTVLDVVDESARLVQAGAPLMTIGDLTDMQIEVDFLSSDAVRITPGAHAHIERWGGPGVIDAQVSRIDPSGFSRVSALGIEEQRVRVILEIGSPPEMRAGLGDRYSVLVRVVVWSADSVLQVPQSALFRQGEDWAVFRVLDDRAVLTPVSIGHRQSEVAEVLGGLTQGDTVITYPGNAISDGTRVVARAVP